MMKAHLRLLMRFVIEMKKSEEETESDRASTIKIVESAVDE